jgi:dipeptidyl aminopeptidase/acylaminoacyl peptidase
MSTDGKWVAFTVSTRVEATNDNTSEVWLVPSDASARERRVSAENANATNPRWLDDGRLVYSSDRQSLSVNPARPDSAPQPATAPAPTGRGGGRGGRGGASGIPLRSPAGNAVAMVRDTPLPAREKVFESDFARRHEERFKGIQFDWMEFQRDGAQFPLPNTADPYLFPPQELFLSSGDGADKQLTHLGVRPEGTSWNRAGTLLVFTADSTYRNEMLYGRSDIWTVTPAGALHKLTSNKDYSYAGAVFSPDGQWILATRSTPTDAVIAKKMDHGGPVDLVLMPANGGAEVSLTENWDYLPSGAFWSPDGQYVYFTGGIGGTTQLFRVSPKTKQVEQVTKGERRLSGFDFDRAITKMAYQVGTFEAPSEIFVANVDASGEKQLTHVGEAFTREIALSRASASTSRAPTARPSKGGCSIPTATPREPAIARTR